MSNEEIALAWERADRMVERIWCAYVTGIGVEQARNDQKSLALWLSIVRVNGYVYNGVYDEYVTLKI